MRKHDDLCPCCGKKMKLMDIWPLTVEAEMMLAEMGDEGELPLFDKSRKRLFEFVPWKRER